MLKKALAHTGRKYSTATSVTWAPPNSRFYYITYWYRQSGVWKYSGELVYPITTSPTSPYALQTTGIDAYDDVRVFRIMREYPCRAAERATRARKNYSL